MKNSVSRGYRRDGSFAGNMRGFTLIELMVTVAVIGVLTAIVMPSYTTYVARGHVTEAVSGLSDMSVKLEQFFQDNRTYVGACTVGTVAPLPATTSYFSYSCSVLSSSAYTVNATGVGTMANFGYSIDQTNTHVTTSLPSGWSGVNNACWVLKRDGSC